MLREMRVSKSIFSNRFTLPWLSPSSLFSSATAAWRFGPNCAAAASVASELCNGWIFPFSVLRSCFREESPTAMKNASGSCQVTCLGIDPGQEVATRDSLTKTTAALGKTMQIVFMNRTFNHSRWILLVCSALAVLSKVDAGVITITRQDTGIISGSIPAYQYDLDGNFLGTIGPQGNSSFIQDIAYDPSTGDLWALIADPNDAAGATIANLTQGTSFLSGQSVFVDRGELTSLYFH